MKINKITDDVFYVSENNFPLDSEKVKKLVDEARKSSRKRARLCVHNDNDSNLHEMFIAKLKNTYVRPHKNHNKCKSFQVLDGIIDLVIFDNFGNITDVVNLGNYGQKNSFFYRLTNTCFHSLIIRSNYAIFKETITGPFNSSDTIYAEWAPMENDEIEVKIYMDKTLNGIKYFLK
jgi:cupin fold WbuC family metalloprotein